MATSRAGVISKAVYAVSALLVLAIFVHSPGMNHYAASSLGKMVYGTAHRPFVYRALVPTMIRATTAAMPSALRQGLIDAAGERPLGAVLAFCDKIPAKHAPELLVALVIMYASLLGFGWALGYLFSGLFRAPDGFRDRVPIFALWLLPPFFCYTSFVYDFPALFFFTLGLGLMLRERWRAYLLLFALSCFNKETTILLAFVFGIHFRGSPRLDRRSFLGLLAAQIVLFVAVKTGLNWAYRGNPGSMVEYHLDHNFDLLRGYSLATGAAWIGVALLVAHRWSDKPPFLKHGLWILVPLVGLTLFLGFLDELRDYYEAFPIVVLLMSHSVAEIVGIALSPAAPARAADAGARDPDSIVPLATPRSAPVR